MGDGRDEVDDGTADDGVRETGSGPDLTKRPPAPRPFVAPGPVAEPAQERPTPAVSWSPGPAPGDRQPPAGVPGGSSAIAVTALVLSLLFFVPVVAAGAAIVLGIVVLALRRPGRGMAISAIVVGSLVLLAQFIVLAVSVADRESGLTAQGGQRDDSSEMVPFYDLESGDCIESLVVDESGETFEVGAVQRVACAEQHEWEVAANETMPPGDYPGDDTVLARTERFCAGEFKGFVGVGVARSELEMYQLFPQRTSWDVYEDYGMTCLIGEGVGRSATGTLRDARR